MIGRTFSASFFIWAHWCQNHLIYKLCHNHRPNHRLFKKNLLFTFNKEVNDKWKIFFWKSLIIKTIFLKLFWHKHRGHDYHHHHHHHQQQQQQHQRIHSKSIRPWPNFWGMLVGEKSDLLNNWSNYRKRERRRRRRRRKRSQFEFPKICARPSDKEIELTRWQILFGHTHSITHTLSLPPPLFTRVLFHTLPT